MEAHVRLLHLDRPEEQWLLVLLDVPGVDEVLDQIAAVGFTGTELGPDGFLPGDADQKLHPYMLPLFDCMDRCLGAFSPQRELISKCTEVAPLQFMRGRTFHDSICILDEAQNCNYGQIKLFLTRFGQNSKVIITGDPMQSDLPMKERSLMNIVDKLSGLKGVGVIHFKSNSIVRHPLIAGILERLEDKENNDGSSST